MKRLREMGYLSDATDRIKMPDPYGGELLQVPARPFEAGPGAPTIEIDESTREEALAICAGFLSPVSGFMPGREVEKVIGLGHLELGFPWPTPQTLAVSGNQPAIEPGKTVILRSSGRDIAELHLQESFERDGQTFVAGMLQAVSVEAALPHSARDLRHRAYERGLRYFCLVVQRTAPGSRAGETLSAVVRACDGVFLLAPAAHCQAWTEVAPEALVAPLPKYLEAHPEFDEIVGRNLGASRIISELC
jgi:hypothetical protein